MYAAYMLLLVLGLRRGEVLGLAWENVDLEQGEAYIAWQLQRVGRSAHGGTEVSHRTEHGSLVSAPTPDAKDDDPFAALFDDAHLKAPRLPRATQSAHICSAELWVTVHEGSWSAVLLGTTPSLLL